MKFARESATETKDLPHEFDARESSDSRLCHECLSVAGDPRHLAWEKSMLSSRETAQARFERETGS